MTGANPEVVALVAAAYDEVVRAHLEAGTALAPFVRSDEYRQRWMAAEEAEQQRIVSLMEDHLTVPGETSVCRCGHVGYSTPGYLLHLYAVVERDHEQRTGCDL